MSAAPDAGLRATQYAFAAHIRDPRHAPAPADVEVVLEVARVVVVVARSALVVVDAATSPVSSPLHATTSTLSAAHPSAAAIRRAVVLRLSCEATGMVRSSGLVGFLPTTGSPPSTCRPRHRALEGTPSW